MCGAEHPPVQALVCHPPSQPPSLSLLFPPCVLRSCHRPSPLKHRHTHTYTSTGTLTHTHRHMQTQAPRNRHMDTQTQARRRRHRHRHRHTDTRTDAATCQGCVLFTHDVCCMCHAGVSTHNPTRCLCSCTFQHTRKHTHTHTHACTRPQSLFLPVAYTLPLSLVECAAGMLLAVWDVHQPTLAAVDMLKMPSLFPTSLCPQQCTTKHTRTHDVEHTCCLPCLRTQRKRRCCGGCCCCRLRR